MMLIVEDLLSMVPRQNLIVHRVMGRGIYLFNTIATQYQYLNMGSGSVNVLIGCDVEEWNTRRAHIQ